MAAAPLESGSIRAFLALPLAELFQDEVTPFLEKWRRCFPQVRWVRPAGIHMTLHFFGSITKDQVSKIGESVRPAVSRTPSFEVFLEGAGAFPDFRRPRVIWIGMEGQLDTLKKLQTEIDTSLSRHGFPVEKRSFKPHLTVGRVREGQKGGAFNRLEFQKTQPKRLTRLVLFQSRLEADGARYETLETYPFSSP